jgi:hypothetical protein
MAINGEERRKYVRIFLAGGQVRLESGQLLPLVGKLVDISLKGIRFSCNSEVKLEDKIDLEITLPNGTKFRCIADVDIAQDMDEKRKTRIYRARFTNLGFKEQCELGDFVMKRRAEQDKLLRKSVIEEEEDEKRET